VNEKGTEVEKYSLDDLKVIYRVLHRHLTEHTELLDNSFFEDLQRHLHRAAQADGVDIGDHGAWDAWLGNEAVSCAVRVERRQSFN
jgi:hypothetical protein